MGKTNSDERCRQPKNCEAKGNGVCRGCSISAISKKLHADPEFRARNHAATSAAVKKMHTDPAYQARHREWTSETAKRLNADPEFKAQARARARKLGKNKRARVKQIATIKRRLEEEPEFLEELKNRMKTNFLSENAAKKRRETRIRKGLELSEVDRKKIARQVRYSTQSLKQIGIEWNRTHTQIAAIAASLGVVRGSHPNALTAVDKQDILEELVTTAANASEGTRPYTIYRLVGENWDRSPTHIRRIAERGGVHPIT